MRSPPKQKSSKQDPRHLPAVDVVLQQVKDQVRPQDAEDHLVGRFTAFPRSSSAPNLSAFGGEQHDTLSYTSTTHAWRKKPGLEEQEDHRMGDDVLQQRQGVQPAGPSLVPEPAEAQTPTGQDQEGDEDCPVLRALVGTCNSLVLGFRPATPHPRKTGAA